MYGIFLRYRCKAAVSNSGQSGSLEGGVPSVLSMPSMPSKKDELLGAADGEYSLALKYDNSCAEAAFGKGLALVNLRRFRAAVDAFVACLAREPHHGRAYHGLGVALVGLQRWARATEALRIAVQLCPEDGVVTAHLGWALWAQGFVPEALNAFREAIRRAPSAVGPYVGLAAVLQVEAPQNSKSSFREALAALRTACSVSDNDVGDVAVRGRDSKGDARALRVGSKNVGSNMTAVLETRPLVPHGTRVLVRQACLDFVRCAKTQGQLMEALDAIQRVVYVVSWDSASVQFPDEDALW